MQKKDGVAVLFFHTIEKTMMPAFRFLCCLTAMTVASATVAQPRVYRCDNATYTNQPEASQGCTPITGGSVTVIEGTRVNPSTSAPPMGQGAWTKVETQEQKQRDAQAVAVLQAELQKAQSRHVEVLKQWNQGEPERLADEYKQPAKYQERVVQLRAALQRSEADVMGLQRELARLAPSVVTGAKP